MTMILELHYNYIITKSVLRNIVRRMKYLFRQDLPIPPLHFHFFPNTYHFSSYTFFIHDLWLQEIYTTKKCGKLEILKIAIDEVGKPCLYFKRNIRIVYPIL